MPITYQQTMDREIHARVLRKHQKKVNDLKRLGFEEAYFFGETARMLGFIPLGLAGFFGTLIALFNETTKISGNLDVNVFNVVMINKEYATYACPFGLGVKFYTGFTDGTCLISANFESPTIRDDKEKLYKFALPQIVITAGFDHQKLVNKLCLDGKRKIEHLSFAGYLQLAQREDDYMLRHKNKTIIGNLLLTSMSGIISIGPIVWLVFFVGFILAILQGLFPACLIVSANEKIVPLQNLFVAVASILLSWILARFQKNMFTMNGSGTKLFGRIPIPGTQEYVATKWLTLIIPLLPVRSYRIAGEYAGPQEKTYYSMNPLERLDWRQVKQTIREWWLGYLIFISIIVFVFIALPVWKCL